MEYMYINQTMQTCNVDGCPLAMAYVPMQIWQQLYDPEVGFDKGTIFKELDKPFCGKEVCSK